MGVVDVAHLGLAHRHIGLRTSDRNQVGGRLTKLAIVNITEEYIALTVLHDVIAMAKRAADAIALLVVDGE